MHRSYIRVHMHKYFLIFFICLSGKALALPDANQIEFGNCSLTLPGTQFSADARCGTLDVPENPDDPDGRQISLKIALAPATGRNKAPDPVFFFAGGPGQAASETWVIIKPTLEEIRKTRDIVMIDQRGTGGSNKLGCTSEAMEDLNQDIDLELVRTETEKCLAALSGDPRFYTTTIAMADYNRVRQAMGYDKINLMGVSYGTRAAQVYLRNYPDTVRTVTLDSVVPMQLALGQEHAVMLDKSVAAVFDDCANDADCHEQFPIKASDLTQLFTQLRESPEQITITNPVTGLNQTMLISADVLAAAIRFLSYSSESQALIPLLVHEALSSGDLSRLAVQAMLVMQGLNEAMAQGMEMSVLCNEDYPYLDMAADNSQTLLGDLFLQVTDVRCKVWPRTSVPNGFHEPVVSDVPVLLMSGSRDPVTPPEYAALAAESFSNSLNLTAQGQAHSVMKNFCLKNITTEFIESGSVDGLDTGCVANIQPSPFFTSLLGPKP